MVGGRYSFNVIWGRITKSLKNKEVGLFKGQDHLGNKYFEIDDNPKLGHNKPKRWFECAEGRIPEDELPVEWESWLRYRRGEPPAKEEIEKNMGIIHMKKENAKELARQRGETISSKRHNLAGSSFPRYEEYEIYPGEKMDKK